MSDHGSDPARAMARLRVLADAARDFAAASADYPRLLDLIAQRLGQEVGDLCVIRMVSADGRWLEATGSLHHADPEVVAAARAAMLGLPMRVGEGLAGRAAARGESIMLAAVDPEAIIAQADPRYAAFLERYQVTSLVVVPLVSAGRVLGVLSLARDAAAPRYTEDDVALVQDLAVHAALALSNSRLIEASRRDHAQRMRTEEVLRRGFLEAAPDGVLIVDRDGRIILVNARAEDLFGYERDELVGQSVELLVPPRLRGTHAVLRADFLDAPAPRAMAARRDLTALRRDGAEFLAEISLSPIDTPDGMLVAATVRDVTVHRREVEAQRRRLLEASRLKSEFLANMSHELRTPLNAVIGFASLMHAGRTGPLTEEQREYLGDMLHSSRHLLQLINDVLDLSKIESGKVELQLEAVEPDKLAREVRDIVRGLAADRRITLALEVDPALPPVVVDARRLKQVLYNYVSNAIKFTPEGGRVIVRIGPEGDDRFRIDVEDSGIGIAPGDVGRLFVEFQQLDQGAAKRYPGTGLGLALTRRIVEAHGGEVAVASAPGVGSTFSAVLPRITNPTGGTVPPRQEQG